MLNGNGDQASAPVSIVVNGVLFKDAIETQGWHNQIDKAIEEFAELITALQHVKSRGHSGIKEVEEELPQATLMLLQLAYIFYRTQEEFQSAVTKEADRVSNMFNE